MCKIDFRIEEGAGDLGIQDGGEGDRIPPPPSTF